MVEQWDWNRKLPMWDWYTVLLAGYPEWEKPDGETPASALISVKNDTDKSSHDLAVEVDDWCKGQFYYRDYTDDGIPFVNEGEVYKSRFWFQFVPDAEEFWKRYGGREQPSATNREG